MKYNYLSTVQLFEYMHTVYSSTFWTLEWSQTWKYKLFYHLKLTSFLWNAVLKSLCCFVLMPLGLLLLYIRHHTFVRLVYRKAPMKAICYVLDDDTVSCIVCHCTGESSCLLCFIMGGITAAAASFELWVCSAQNATPATPSGTGFSDDSLCVFADYYCICFLWDHKSFWVCYFGMLFSGFARSTGQIAFVHLLYKKQKIWKSF